MVVLSDNLKSLQAEIAAAARKAGRDPQEVLLLAVTKTVGIEDVRRAAALGLQDFGENRLQEAAQKLQAFSDLRWHFIGHLQTNKVKQVLESFSLIHSLDRLTLAKELQRWGDRLEKEIEALIQVNVSGEDSKFGLEPSQLPDFLLEISELPRIKVKGLMTMAPWVEDPEEVRPLFRQLRELRQANARPCLPLHQLSMGMTNDYAIAVEEGATIVRIGSALFGPRK